MGNIYSVSAEVKPATGAEGEGGGTVWKTNEEEDRQILQGVNEKMRRRDGEKEEGKKGEKAEIPSSGFSLKPPVKVNEGCSQSSETDHITAPLINGVSMHFSLCVCARVCVAASILVQLDVLNHSLTCMHQCNVLVSVYMCIQMCARILPH